MMKGEIIQIMLPQRFASPLLFAGAVLLLSLTPPVRADFLSGSVVQQQINDVNLTAQGTLDWAVWGVGADTSLAPNVQEDGGAGISDLTDLTNGSPLRGLGQYGGYGESTFNWSNGTPTPSAANAFTGLQNNGSGLSSGTDIGEGFSFSVPADLLTQEVYIYTTVNVGVATVTATLSDGGASPVVLTLDGSGLFNGAFVTAFIYSGDSPSETLNVSLVLSQDGSGDDTSNIAIQAIALGSTGAVPEPSTLALCGAGMALASLAGLRRRKGRAAAV
jgi:hypothetical protein